MRFQILRKKYPKFIYKSYRYKIIRGNLKISFIFEIPPDIKFKPEIIIKNVPYPHTKQGYGVGVDILMFNLGMMEIPTYWKTTCSPEIEIQAGCLSREQINWWKKLLIDGMGQFFYENKIDWTCQNFIKISDSQASQKLKRFNNKLKNRYLVPFAGGRDSIVTLESLKKSAKRRKEIALFMVNPTARILKTAKISGIKKQIIVKRIIDKKLLELNEKGYLNGHTPFTALLSFLSVICAVIFNYKNIAFSNEKSANEGNLKYLGKTINHQWAKSSAFEKMFRNYAKKFLAKDINYFSYLRKYNELEASKMLIKYPEYFPFFSSCNAGMRISPPKAKAFRRVKWCGNCPKCLFVYATFYPFLNKKDLIKIFSSDFFENQKLLPMMKALIEKGRAKPFECVGTKKESQLAFRLSLEKALRQAQDKPIPYLLTKIK